MAKPVVIGSRSFRTQSSALDHYKALLHRYPDGQRIVDSADHTDLVALIERFDPALDAVGEPTKGTGQIAYFERRLNTGTGWSTSGFWIVRQEGTETDFSYIDAVKGKPKGRSQDFYNACRQAVALDLVLAKKQAFAQYGDDQGQAHFSSPGSVRSRLFGYLSGLNHGCGCPINLHVYRATDSPTKCHVFLSKNLIFCNDSIWLNVGESHEHCRHR